MYTNKATTWSRPLSRFYRGSLCRNLLSTISHRKGLVDPGRTRGGSRRYSEADIALLRRIQELTNDGLNLAGVKRVLELEDRVAELEERNRQLSAEIAERVDEVHRQYRRDLVPLHQAVVRYERPRR